MSPFTDFGFRKLFAEEANKDLLKDFLNDLLPIPERIKKLSFKKNVQLGNGNKDRSAVFDIFCEDSRGQQFIVEMQNARQTYFRDRAIFYSTFPIRDQAKKGNWNFHLQPVYCVGLLGFCLQGRPAAGEKIFKDYIHCVQLKDQKNEIFYDKLTYLFIELPRFRKKAKELETHFEKWLYFLKRLPTFDDIPAILNEKIFVKAFEVAELANLTSEQRLIYESSLKAYRDNINVIETARIEGRAEGEAKGRAEGEAKGRAEGEAKGRAEGEAKGRAEGEVKGRAEGEAKGRTEERMEVAKKLLQLGTSLETIQQVTGFSKKEIQARFSALGERISPSNRD